MKKLFLILLLIPATLSAQKFAADKFTRVVESYNGKVLKTDSVTDATVLIEVNEPKKYISLHSGALKFNILKIEEAYAGKNYLLQYKTELFRAYLDTAWLKLWQTSGTIRENVYYHLKQ